MDSNIYYKVVSVGKDNKLYSGRLYPIIVNKSLENYSFLSKLLIGYIPGKKTKAISKSKIFIFNNYRAAQSFARYFSQADAEAPIPIDLQIWSCTANNVSKLNFGLSLMNINHPNNLKILFKYQDDKTKLKNSIDLRVFTISEHSWFIADNVTLLERKSTYSNGRKVAERKTKNAGKMLNTQL